MLSRLSLHRPTANTSGLCVVVQSRPGVEALQAVSVSLFLGREFTSFGPVEYEEKKGWKPSQGVRGRHGASQQSGQTLGEGVCCQVLKAHTQCLGDSNGWEELKSCLTVLLLSLCVIFLFHGQNSSEGGCSDGFDGFLLES